MKKLVLMAVMAFFSTLTAENSKSFLYNEFVEAPEKTEELSPKELFLVEHVEKSVLEAEALRSKLQEPQLAIAGMSSIKVRHFLNQLCTLPECTYLEIGSYKGSTLIGALYGNKENLIEATACDNWSEFGGPRNEFMRNCESHLSGYPLAIHECDSFDLDLKEIAYPVKVYFYDGNHTAESQEKAFTYYTDVLDDHFIAIVDDWNWDAVREGTFAAFKKLGYRVVFEKHLPARFNQDKENYWNGLYVAVISKN